LKSESQSAAVAPDKLFILSFFIQFHPISSVSAFPAAKDFLCPSLSGFFGDKYILKKIIL
jgi:hypothetical protein